MGAPQVYQKMKYGEMENGEKSTAAIEELKLTCHGEAYIVKVMERTCQYF